MISPTNNPVEPLDMDDMFQKEIHVNLRQNVAVLEKEQ